MAIHTSNGKTYLTFDLFNQFEIRHGVFMRHGGVSPNPWKSLNMATSVGDSKENVLGNRARVAQALGIKEESFFDVWQIHSSHVISATKPRPPGTPHQQGDAIITEQDNISLLMLFADCVPVFLFDIHKRVAALVHAGWEGTAKQVVSAAIDMMRSNFGCHSHDLIAGIGPAISVDRYEIRPELLDHFYKAPYKLTEVVENRDGSVFLDLKKANELLIHHEGITQIENMNICTASCARDWFSHRAENGSTGRFAAVMSVN